MADIEKGNNPSELSWQAPAQDVRGNPVNGPLNYRLYRSETEVFDISAGHFYEVIGELQPEGNYVAPLGDFPPGRNVIALTAVDADGDESALSNTMGFNITNGVNPNPPRLLDL